MARKGKRGPYQRHGSRKLIEGVFDAAGAGATLPTSAIFQRVNKAAGKKVPEFSVRSAIRTLVKNRRLRQQRRGRQMFFTDLGRTRTAAPGKPAAPSPVAGPVAVATAAPVATVSTAAEMPHRLGVGEALVLSVGDTHVEAITNVHGQLVVQHHPRKRTAAT